MEKLMRKLFAILTVALAVSCSVTNIDETKNAQPLKGFYSKVRSINLAEVIEDGKLKSHYEDDEEFDSCYVHFDSIRYSEFVYNKDKNCFSKDVYGYELNIDTIKGDEIYYFKKDEKMITHVYLLSKFKGDTLLLEMIIRDYYFESKTEGIMKTTSYFLPASMLIYNNLHACTSE
jgi:hypothetical protein